MSDVFHCFTCGGTISGVGGYRPVPSKTAQAAPPKDEPCLCQTVTAREIETLGLKVGDRITEPELMDRVEVLRRSSS